jgi:hypothetical protein
MFRWQRIFMIMDPDPAGGGGGGGTGNPPAPAKPDAGADLAALKSQNEALMKRLEALEGKGNPPPKDDSDLADKARKEREKAEASNADSKKLESALRFSLGAPEWLKTNATLLPKTIEGILAQADKENYGNAVEKDSAIKAGIISEFFAIQANTDLLTASQKLALEDFQKLTKNVKQERAQQIFDSIFEPTFEMLKRIKKAEQLSKGTVDQSDVSAAHRDKIVNFSRKHFLGEKK